MFGYSRYSLPIIAFFVWLTFYLLKVTFWPKNEEAMPWHLRLVPLTVAIISGAIATYFVILQFSLSHLFW